MFYFSYYRFWHSVRNQDFALINITRGLFVALFFSPGVAPGYYMSPLQSYISFKSVSKAFPHFGGTERGLQKKKRLTVFR